MNLDELRDIQTRERSTNSLQELPDSFYTDVADYVSGLKEERKRAASEADDPFASPEVSRLTDEIQMAEQVVEAIYERRVGKTVKQASLAAADMQSDESGLTAEERALYDDLVGRIEQNKSRVLDVLAGEDTEGSSADAGGTAAAATAGTGREPSVLDGEAPGAGNATDATPDSSDDAGERVSAADAMGDPEGERRTRRTATGDAREGQTPAEPSRSTDGGAVPASAAPGGSGAGSPADGRPEPETGDRGAADGGESGTAGGEGRFEEGTSEPRTTVRITRDVGEIFGVDERTYSLESEDVVSLPEANVSPLVEKEAAERL